MSGRCRSTLAPLARDGFTSAVLRRLTGSGRQLPIRVDFTRADIVRERGIRSRRLSIPGVQDKISLRLVRGRLVVADIGGEFILKPIPGTPLLRFHDQVPANEHVTMQIARQIFGIDVAATALIDLADGERAYLTRRFDRRTDGTKRPVEDFRSLAQQSPDTHGANCKYDASSCADRMAELVRRSFLSPETQDVLLSTCTDRHRTLLHPLKSPPRRPSKS